MPRAPRLPSLPSAILLQTMPPLSVQIQPPEPWPLTAGREYLVLCVVIGARPPPTVTWWFGHQRVLQSSLENSQKRLPGMHSPSFLELHNNRLTE
ncbi:hypothetical protein E2C01_082748 [Portunus trituberculatus]|uniref:Ig-like domain-containing protein n=1 Tax=Portunus trituberculatus TaxID=210409 RepID=A0A5B7J4K9_PORTR|nr:hypothetical protein [Portunus trituberculatus]